MTQLKAILFLAVGLGIWFAGCKVTKQGTPYGNQPPTTQFSVAPRDGATVNNFLEFRWSGNDADGSVVGYWMISDGDTLDGNLSVSGKQMTTTTDTTLTFAAPTLDSVPHHFSVVSVDNEGAVDPNPPVKFFYTKNYPPSAAFVQEGTIPADTIVGRGFRVTLTAADTNALFSQFAVSIDDSNNFNNWTTDSVFLYADPVLIADTSTFAHGVVPLDNAPLIPGSHTLYARARDAGGAVSPLLIRHFTVRDNLKPSMNLSVTGTYGDGAFYPDGSAYIIDQTGTVTKLSYSAQAFDSATGTNYHGEINAYNYRLLPGNWVGWSRAPIVNMTDLPEGEYPFEFIARDVANVITSDTARYTVRIVRQRLSTNMIIVSETRDGTGRVGSPHEADVIQFYERVMATVSPPLSFRTIRYVGDTTRPDTGYISPFDLKDAGIVMWHGDDNLDVFLNFNFRVLTSFLNRGGRLMISGRDVFQGFSAEFDTLTFSQGTTDGAFALNYLRCFQAWSSLSPDNHPTTTGWLGVNGYPSVQLDPAKLIPTWNGAMDYCWAFQPRGECTVIGTLTANGVEPNLLVGHPTAYLYDLSFRTALFGIPLYYCHEEQVAALMDVLVPHMMVGLPAPH